MRPSIRHGPALPDVSRTAFCICTGTAALPGLIVLNRRTPQLPEVVPENRTGC